MERRFPKNVKQIGNVSDSPRIYMEDYVHTFLGRWEEQEETSVQGVFLIGERVTVEEQECVFVTGAVRMQDISMKDGMPTIGKEHLEVAKTEANEYFHGQDIVGWCLLSEGESGGLKKGMTLVHESLFPEKNSLFILIENGEEIYYAYKFRELMTIGGHYIYYEKNPDMQSYMIHEGRVIGVTPSEVVEDQAAKNFRSSIRGQMARNGQRRESRYVYLTSLLLVVVVLAIGIGAMNNYDKINSVQASIERVSSSLRQEDKKKEKLIADVQETELNGDNSEAQDDTEAVKTEPEKSTIQQDLAEEEYYTVKKGDTLDTISKKLYGTSGEADAICRMNGLRDGNLIFIGQKLLLP